MRVSRGFKERKQVSSSTETTTNSGSTDVIDTHELAHVMGNSAEADSGSSIWGRWGLRGWGRVRAITNLVGYTLGPWLA